MKEILTSGPTMSLDRAREILAAEGIQMGRTTIWRIATKKLGLSFQKASLKPAVVFGRQTMQRRFDYAQRVNQLPDQELWFLDESGFNLHIAPLRCWAPKGRTPTLAVKTNRGVNISLLMCISSEGIVYYEIKNGSFKAPVFVDFLAALADHYPEVRNGEVTLVMDNARIHHASDAQDCLRDNNINHVYLPPYSPELNPIERSLRFSKDGSVAVDLSTAKARCNGRSRHHPRDEPRVGCSDVLRPYA